MTDSTLISRAAEFAARAHAGQTRRGSDTLCNISDSPTPQQAATYAAIQRRLQAAPPAAWDSLHAQLSAAIIKEYEARFETPNN